MTAMNALALVVLLGLWLVQRMARQAALLEQQVVSQQRTAERQFRELLDALPDASLLLNLQGRIVQVNPAAEKLFGYSAAELRWQPVDMLLPAPLRLQHTEYRNQFLANPGRIQIGEACGLCGQHKQGQAFQITVTAAPIKIGNESLVACFVHDISAHLRAEQVLAARAEALARSNLELENFANIASHDLRAPLRGIGQLASWLEEDLGPALSDRGRDYLNKMRSRIRRMDSLLKDLLDYARISIDDESQWERIDIGTLARDAFEMASPKTGLQLQLGDELPVLNTLRVPLEQVLRNLIGNAVKHHDREQGIVRISARHQDGYYHITVGDDGPGIRPELHEKAFGMFQTLRPRDEAEGSGMGLATVRKIAGLYGGEVSLHSDGVRGTAICFSWPDEEKLREILSSHPHPVAALTTPPPVQQSLPGTRNA